jgi:PKD repeat protein
LFGTLVTSAAHLYPSAQVFTVTVTVTDSTGATSSAAVQLPVSPLTASVTSQPQAETHGVAASFTVASVPAGASIDHYEWDFGPGEGTVQSTAGGTNVHTFTNIGARTIVVTVVPSVGNRIIVPISVNVG